MAFFNFGKISLSGKKSTLGIDIGTASVKLVELNKDGGRFRLDNYGLFELESIALPAGYKLAGDTGGLSAFDEELVWGIKQTLERSNISTREAVASIPSFSAFSTIITMPYLSEQDIARTIPFEARKYIPVPLDQVILDWSIINVAPNASAQIVPGQAAGEAKAPTVEVFIVAVSKIEANRYQNIMRLAGLNLRALEIENSALIRSLVGNDLSTMAIINIGGRSTSILIVDNGYERVSHNYEVGGAEVTQAIAKSLGVSLQRAEELKRSLGAQPENSELITEVMSSLVDLIIFETNKTIHNYQDWKGSKVSKIILVGGLSNMPAFVNYFAEKLGSPVQFGNPLARIVYPPSLEPIRGELNSTFAIAFGLAMREL